VPRSRWSTRAGRTGPSGARVLVSFVRPYKVAQHEQAEKFRSGRVVDQAGELIDGVAILGLGVHDGVGCSSTSGSWGTRSPLLHRSTPLHDGHGPGAGPRSPATRARCTHRRALSGATARTRQLRRATAADPPRPPRGKPLPRRRGTRDRSAAPDYRDLGRGRLRSRGREQALPCALPRRVFAF